MKYSESLKKNRDFQLVYKSGTSKANRYLVMYVREKSVRKKQSWHIRKQKGGKQCCETPSCAPHKRKLPVK